MRLWGTVAGGWMLAQGALDRALTKTCSQAAGFASEAEKLPGGLIASFDAGMASALCGDKAGAERAITALQQSFPHSTAVTGYYVADLQAAMDKGVTVAEVASSALGIEVGKIKDADQKRISKALTSLGWKLKRTGPAGRFYVPA